MSEPIVGFSKFVEMVQTFRMFISSCCTVNEEHAKILKVELENQRTTLAVLGESMTIRFWGPYARWCGWVGKILSPETLHTARNHMGIGAKSILFWSRIHSDSEWKLDWLRLCIKHNVSVGYTKPNDLPGQWLSMASNLIFKRLLMSSKIGEVFGKLTICHGTWMNIVTWPKPTLSSMIYLFKLNFPWLFPGSGALGTQKKPSWTTTKAQAIDSRKLYI